MKSKPVINKALGVVILCLKIGVNFFDGYADKNS